MRSITRSLLLVALCVLAACSATPTRARTDAAVRSPVTPTGFLFDSVTVNGETHAFAVYVPRAYTPDRTWPVIVFLNGSGECGTDGQKQLAVGLAPAIMLNAKAWEFIVVFPQKPTQRSAWLEHDALVLACLDRTLESYSTDRSRVYLTGLSQGGRGTWEIGARHAARFAAIAPICGWGDPGALAPALESMPVWAFHGEKDTVVPPSGTRNIVEALEKSGAHPRMTLYPDAGHNSWDKAYRDEGLGAWFLEHAKK